MEEFYYFRVIFVTSQIIFNRSGSSKTRIVLAIYDQSPPVTLAISLTVLIPCISFIRA